jgi:DNA uptake protein ComE-like DNA-binding protein
MGRPDRARKYDAGLIDINSAPAEVFVSVCGIARDAAERLVTTREQYASGFTSVEEVLAYVDMSQRDADVLRDRGLVLPS